MSKVKIKTTGDVKVVIGPTQDVPGPSYENPADQLRLGPLPVRTSPDQVLRRPFAVPTKSTLHRQEGLSNEECNQPGYERSVGSDANKYSQGPNDEMTKGGARIYGT